MTRGRARTVGGLLAALVASPLAGAAPAAAMDTTSELIRLADVVSFLRRRVLTERPELLADREGQGAAFRAELSRLDLDPPEGVPLDVRIDDLKLAGLLLEEQLRRRRTTRRHSILAETTAAFELPPLREEEAVPAPAEEPSVVPEVARLFSAIHQERSKVSPLPGPHPAGGFASSPAKASRREADAAATDMSLADELAEVGARLRAALARMDAVVPADEDPSYGDRSKRVSGIQEAASTDRDEPVEEAVPAAASEPVEVARVLPPPVARQPDLDTRRTAVADAAGRPEVEAKPIPGAEAPARQVAAATLAPAGLPREQGVAAVLAQVLPLVQGQQVSPSQFPAVMSATLATFGVKVPGGFQPRPEDSPEAMARELLATSGGVLDVSMAAAALGI